jgi:hypothetical protein
MPLLVREEQVMSEIIDSKLLLMLKKMKPNSKDWGEINSQDALRLKLLHYSSKYHERLLVLKCWNSV